MHYHVTAENIEAVKLEMSALDQIAEVTPGCEVWSFTYEGGQSGQIIVFPDAARAGICFGGNTEWGDWDSNVRTIHLDVAELDGTTIVYDENGERVEADDA